MTILGNVHASFFMILDWSFSFVKIGTNSSASFKIVAATLNSVSSFSPCLVQTITAKSDDYWFDSTETDGDDGYSNLS
jgi:hypothetical protein